MVRSSQPPNYPTPQQPHLVDALTDITPSTVTAFAVAAPGRVRSYRAPRRRLRWACTLSFPTRCEDDLLLPLNAISDLRLQISDFVFLQSEIINLKSAIPCGADGIRTHYLFNAIEALSQLSYSPGSVTSSQFSVARNLTTGYCRLPTELWSRWDSNPLPLQCD